jgi:hypothetical protein
VSCEGLSGLLPAGTCELHAAFEGSRAATAP